MTKAAIRLAVSLTTFVVTLGGAWAQALNIEVLPSRPELTRGGSALARITGASGAPAVTLDGKDVSGAFKADSRGRFVGLVEGLKEGDNRLVAKDQGRE